MGVADRLAQRRARFFAAYGVEPDVLRVLSEDVDDLAVEIVAIGIRPTVDWRVIADQIRAGRVHMDGIPLKAVP